MQSCNSVCAARAYLLAKIVIPNCVPVAVVFLFISKLNQFANSNKIK